MPDLAHEALYAGPVCGVDEVGRGPLAGPVVAAAVILPQPQRPEMRDLIARLDDSKKLSAKARTALAELIRTHCHYALAEVGPREIERINILQATFKAMRKAVAALPVPPATALIDGNQKPGLAGIREVPLVKGDTLSASIAAASILAKTWRDNLMAQLDEVHPGYGWARNAGYGTAQHLEALQQLGLTPHHRMTFKPICEHFATHI